MEEPLNNFKYAEELHSKASTGQEKLILVSAVQLLLNYWQEHLFVKKCIYSEKIPAFILSCKGYLEFSSVI